MCKGRGRGGFTRADWRNRISIDRRQDREDNIPASPAVLVTPPAVPPTVSVTPFVVDPTVSVTPLVVSPTTLHDIVLVCIVILFVLYCIAADETGCI